MRYLFLALVAFVCCVPTVLTAQSSRTIYFDADWQKTYKGNHSYYRVVYLASDGGFKAPFYDYYRDGTVQAKVDVDSYNLDCGMTPWECSSYGNGDVTVYNRDGSISTRMRVKNGSKYGYVNYSSYGSVTSAYGCTLGDCHTGYGTYYYADGDNYSGSFRGGKRHGQGKYTWSSGKTYTGAFAYDEIDRSLNRQPQRFSGQSGNKSSDWTLEDTKTTLEIAKMIWDFFDDDDGKKN